MLKTEVQKGANVEREHYARDDLQTTGEIVRPADTRIHHDGLGPVRLRGPNDLDHHVERRPREPNHARL